MDELQSSPVPEEVSTLLTGPVLSGTYDLPLGRPKEQSLRTGFGDNSDELLLKSFEALHVHVRQSADERTLAVRAFHLHTVTDAEWL